MKTLLSLAVAVLLAGCVSVPQNPRVDVQLTGLRYNQLASSYINYPVFVEHSDKMLILLAQGYTANPSRFMVEKTTIPEFITAIDKYLEWEKLAAERGEQITKKIASLNYHGANLVIQFHSASKGNHVFSVGIRSKVLGDSWDIPGVTDLILDKQNVLSLRKLLIDYRDGAIRPLNTDQIYK